jgi:copper homeostasis protein CutC
MCEDIQIFKAAGATGVVFGVLTPAGNIDIEKTQR